jgi:deoxyribodipyrimidine photolyase
MSVDKKINKCIYLRYLFIIIIMDIQVDFFRWQVLDLKEYLQHRGVTCHLYRKHELVKLCELAQELDLEKITSTKLEQRPK